MLYRKTQSALMGVAFLKVQLGDIVTDMRGKSGGMVYQKGRYGLIKRTKVTPVNPQSTVQQTNRGLFASVSSAWRGLTEAQRNSWKSAAPEFPFSDIFGNRQTLSGNSLYIKLNQVLEGLGIASNATAPDPVAVPLAVVGTIAADASAHTLSIPFTDTPVPAGFELQIEATPQVSAGINFFKNKYKKLMAVDAAGTSPVSAGTAYEAMFGTLTSGTKLSVRAYFVSKTTGQVGIATASDTIVVP